MNKLQISEAGADNLLRYGTILSDENTYDGVQQRWVRIRVIRSRLGWLFYTKMVTGRWVEVRKLSEAVV